MYRVILAVLASLFICSATVQAKDLSDAFTGTPALSVNFDGSRHVDVCHKGQQETAPKSADKEEVTFEKSDGGEVPSTAVLVGVGALAAALGVAAQWKNIAKNVTPVH